jgi:hypothetical protein
VGDFQVATSGGFWVATGGRWLAYLLLLFARDKTYPRLNGTQAADDFEKSSSLGESRETLDKVA